MKKLIITIVILSNLVLADFTRTSNGIVIDSSTNLQWQDNKMSNNMNWQNAVTYCENLTLGEYTDWRLPNRNELISIVDVHKFQPALSGVFKYIGYTSYWSSTTGRNSSSAWYVHYYKGNSNFRSKTSLYFARCVRGGL